MIGIMVEKEIVMQTVRKRAESKIEQDDNGSWNLWVRPVGENDWILSSSSTDKDSMQLAADWWNGQEIEWDIGEDDDR